MYEISICLSQASVDVSQLAGRLGGICSEEIENDRGIEQKFVFSLESFAYQFSRALPNFTEVRSISPSQNAIKEAIAKSRLCPCGEMTILDCDGECNRYE